MEDGFRAIQLWQPAQTLHTVFCNETSLDCKNKTWEAEGQRGREEEMGGRGKGGQRGGKWGRGAEAER